ncbi:hypothetical protein [Telluria antibiotica]|uniref:hypothetical protein n=1 Tax=Telluria antibiotica TaxID=2717319 RepID=UPI001AAEA61F|nr:hypothetical protein [Telluria antibiotica]
MLELHNVTKTFGKNVTAVADASLRLATLTRPSGGRILFDGGDVVARPDALRNRLGYLPQDFDVYRNVTALEFMRHFAALKGVRDAGRIRRLLA